VEIGSDQLKMGGVYRVKPLGVYAMIDDGELDWKVSGRGGCDATGEDLLLRFSSTGQLRAAAEPLLPFDDGWCCLDYFQLTKTCWCQAIGDMWLCRLHPPVTTGWISRCLHVIDNSMVWDERGGPML
jgi:hypothetical protein